MAEIFKHKNNAELLSEVLKGHSASISRHWERLFNETRTARWIQKQVKGKEDILQDNFYFKFLKWLYSIEAATWNGSRLLVADILSRFPLTEAEKKKLSLTQFLEDLGKLVGEITALAVIGRRDSLKVKILEGQLLFQQMAYSL